jgi:uncharacterized membrane protein YjgN (DUF898 family)
MDEVSEGSAPDAQALPKMAFAAGPPRQPDVLGPLFTGSGKEYFRIWIVNLMLIVATLGIYSAWAKVRRLQYFDRNTRIGGAVFDFRGDPLAILRGRVVAVVMLGLYHYAFGFSTAVALTILGVLFLALPYLLRGAMRFRLQNTYYRGLPFAFTGSIAGAYAVFLPFMVLFVGPAASLALDPSGMLAGLTGLLYLAFPLLYGRLKAYQHDHVRFGAARSSYDVSPWRFYRFYLVALGLVLLIGTVLGIVAASSMWLFKDLLKTYPVLGGVMAFGGVAAGYLSVLLLFPYMVARTANLVWSNTSFPGIAMQSDMSARAFARLQIVNVLLTIVTLGLFRPFAVVRIHQFRLAALTIIAEGGFEPALAVAAAGAGSGGALGDGAADFFGFDLSL